jgi:ABC-type molybdate transport system substrate-binding protein
VRIPDDLTFGAVYGIGATMNAAPGGAEFVQFALGPQGRAILAGFGFDGPRDCLVNR